MSSDPSIWYRVGYALERARAHQPSSEEEAAPQSKRGRSRSAKVAEPAWPSADDLIASGVAALAGRLLGAWRPTRKVTFSRLLRAGAAGAGAALLLDMLKPLISGRAELPVFDREMGSRLLAGAGQGLLYGSVVEPRVPGPAVVKGVVFALAEYMADPAGGLTHLLGSHTPQGRLPVVAGLLEELEPHDREYLEHLAFGVALAVLCGASPSRNGAPEGDIED